MEFLVVLCLLALVPASIANNKGRSFGLWYLYGFCFWLIALIHSLAIAPAIRGLRISHVASGSVGDRGGLLPGDIVLDLNGGRPKTTSEFLQLIRPDRQRVTVYRSGRIVPLTTEGGKLGVNLSETFLSEAIVAIHSTMPPQLGNLGAPPNASAAGTDPYRELQQLKALLDQGILSAEEFELKRKAIVAQL